MHGMIDLVQFAESNGESWIQIMKTGKWDHPKLKEIQITESDLARFKANFDNRVRGVDLAVDISHNPDAGAVGWFKELRVDGSRLMARVDWTEEGASLVKGGKYRYFSPEFMFRWKDPANGQEYHDVLLGGALTNRPFLKDMEPIAFSESGMAEVWMAEGEPYDPDHNGDNDATANPAQNPDWMEDVKRGITPWDKCTPDQKQQLIAKGITHHVAHRAHAEFMAAHPHLKMAEDDITNSHKTPPKGKPKNRALYADPDHYKYPIDAKHIRAAVRYFNQSGMQSKGGYSDAQWADIGKRIVDAANRLIGPGHKFADGKIDTNVKMTEGDPDDYDVDGIPEDPDDGNSSPHPNDDTDAGKFTDGGGNPMPENVVTMAEFQAAQAKIQLLETENRRTRMSEKVRGWLFDEKSRTGKLVPAQQDKVVDMLMSMSEEQVTQFEEFVGALPPAVSFGEFGTAGAIVARLKDEGDKSDQVAKLAEKYEREGMAWKEAFIRASDELGVE